jgi:hypothetical protein
VWQKRYLDRHGLQLSDLVDQLEAGRDLRDLLELPFFLALVVRMRDRLGGLDLYGVVGKLVDEALRVQGQQALLPVGVEIAREWFEDLALGLHLSGETLIRDADLDRMTIPSAATSSPREVCEWLVSRMMFQPRNDGYAFTHRLIGEALAAAALDRRDPIPELLDAIAPVISEEVRGVRADWRVPMTFLMQRNASWRAAIRERDEMQWARTVPAEPLEERREAAELLWSRYVDWRVWIWNYELPDIVQDATALARHLRAGGLDDLVATIRGAFHDQNPRTRGNAIRVLSEAHLPDLDLRESRRARRSEQPAPGLVAGGAVSRNHHLDAPVCAGVELDDQQLRRSVASLRACIGPRSRTGTVGRNRDVGSALRCPEQVAPAQGFG